MKLNFQKDRRNITDLFRTDIELLGTNYYGEKIILKG